jgi:3-oxoacyl-[acyl-carrier-protein] synthase II
VEPRVLTGLGVVSPIGIGRDAFFASLSAPLPSMVERPAATIESFDATKYAPLNIAEVSGFDPSKYLGDKGLRTLDRLTKLMLVAARLALVDAGVRKDGAYLVSSAERCGVVSSNAYGSLEAITELDRVAKLEDARYINPSKFPNTVANSASGYVSIWEELRALNVAVSDGNCGGLDAIACADLFLVNERADILVVGGAEAMSEALCLAFMKLGALSRTAMISEAAVFCTMESEAHARARNAKELGRVVGYGTAFEAPADESSLVYASATAQQLAIESALADANLQAKDIDAVAASLNGIALFDRAEMQALKATVPNAAWAAPKKLYGDALGAGGSMGIATALAWLQGAPVLPCVHGTSPARCERVLVTSMGYYGNASALVLERGRQHA